MIRTTAGAMVCDGGST